MIFNFWIYCSTNTLFLKKIIFQKNAFKTSLLPLSNNDSELSTSSTLCTSEAKVS